VFLSPAEPGLYLVKRIIGLPGDRIHLRDGIVYRNGEKLVEPFAQHSVGDYNAYRDNFPATPPESNGNITAEWQAELPGRIQGIDVVVPPASYFGMGDNRDVSRDSRYWGFIPRENVIGRPVLIYWSFETPDGQYLETGIGKRGEIVAHKIIHFFDETRWDRTFRLVN
jgi:signal peptidase I